MEEALQAAAEASGGDLTIEQVTKLHEDQAAKMKEDAGDYMYNLAGILVHAGVAQGGHYYSYIRDRGQAAYDDGGDAATGAGGRGVGAAAAAAEGGGSNGGDGGGGKGAEAGAGGVGGAGAAAAAAGVGGSESATAGGQVCLCVCACVCVRACCRVR